MWTILTMVALILLFLFFLKGPNAVWGGAIIGLIAGIIIALIGDGFNWFIIYKYIVMGILMGGVAELFWLILSRLKSK
jgi:hypothetical protein